VAYLTRAGKLIYHRQYLVNMCKNYLEDWVCQYLPTTPEPPPSSRLSAVKTAVYVSDEARRAARGAGRGKRPPAQVPPGAGPAAAAAVDDDWDDDDDDDDVDVDMDMDVVAPPAVHGRAACLSPRRRWRPSLDESAEPAYQAPVPVRASPRRVEQLCRGDLVDVDASTSLEARAMVRPTTAMTSVIVVIVI